MKACNTCNARYIATFAYFVGNFDDHISLVFEYKLANITSVKRNKRKLNDTMKRHQTSSFKLR